MSEKSHKRGAGKVKHVKLRAHHAKPYRKRHVGGLVLSAATAIFLLLVAYNYSTQVQQGVVRATNFVSGLFAGSTITTSSVESTYGFGLSYNNQVFYGSAVDAATGDLYFENELSTNRAYDSVRISLHGSEREGTSSTFKLRYFDDIRAEALTDSQLKPLDRNSLLAGLDPSRVTLTEITRSQVTLGGVPFTKVEWQLKPKTATKLALNAYATTYVGVVNKRAMVITINTGLAASTAKYDDIVKSIHFGSRTHAATTTSPKVAINANQNRNLLDSVFGAEIAQAASSADNVGASEKTSSIYSPAVVKIYNFYCMDVKVGPSLSVPNICSGASGSGFFVNGNGLIATNGHVATSNTKDVIIRGSLISLSKGDSRYFEYLLGLAKAKESDFSGLATDLEIIDKAIDLMYGIPASSFVESNSVHNLLVDLKEIEPDIKEVVELTIKRKPYPEQDSIKRAELLGSDYRAIDGIKSWKASDVALLKIPGANYPVVKLGSIDGLAQGADIIILGYPGNASDNGIVATDQSKVTLTAGKVSSVKNANGSTKKLIETDTTIGHGNSGGPAFNQLGQVVGIATYTSDGAGKGDGTFNYIRDIKDLKDLAGSVSSTIDSKSATQTEWEKGMTAFYASHYKSAVKTFQNVKKLYASHPKADEFIAAATEHINNGEDVPEINIPLLAGAIVIALSGIGLAVFLIMRQRKLHQTYNTHVASGAIAPIAPGGAPVLAPALPRGPAPVPVMPAAPIAPQAPATPVSAPVPVPVTPTPAPPALNPQAAPPPTIVYPTKVPVQPEQPKTPE